MHVLCSSDSLGNFQFSSDGKFTNSKSGFNQFIKWVRKTGKSLQDVNFLMEATVVYYESLTCHLDKLNLVVNVVLPNTSKHYFSSLNIKTKTDRIDAKVLSQFAIERKHSQWHKPKEIYLELRSLTRYYVQLQENKTILNNQKHSKEASEHTQGFILKLNTKLITQIDNQLEKVKIQIERVCKKDDELWPKLTQLMSIKGVGLITVVTVVAETFGFDQVKI